MLNKLFSNISGWKTFLGGLLHLAWFIYYIWINKEIQPDIQLRGHAIIFVITGVGIGDKIRKYIKSNKGEKLKNTFKIK